ncbi:hypothetical protein [Polaromonas sp. AET17H-212]|nr:hypothetical protein [Polaromonas sp. AET17H-212]
MLQSFVLTLMRPLEFMPALVATPAWYEFPWSSTDSAAQAAPVQV